VIGARGATVGQPEHPTGVRFKTCATVASREIETTVFDPASQFLSNISRRV